MEILKRHLGILNPFNVLMFFTVFHASVVSGSEQMQGDRIMAIAGVELKLGMPSDVAMTTLNKAGLVHNIGQHSDEMIVVDRDSAFKGAIRVVDQRVVGIESNVYIGATQDSLIEALYHEMPELLEQNGAWPMVRTEVSQTSDATEKGIVIGSEGGIILTLTTKINSTGKTVVRMTKSIIAN